VAWTLFAVDSFGTSTDDGVLVRGLFEAGLATSAVLLWTDGSRGGRARVATEGEADAARSCSSRLGGPTNWDSEGEGVEKVEWPGLRAAWNGRVEGSGGCGTGSITGIGRAASSKR
jgi:hypothetical protein